MADDVLHESDIIVPDGSISKITDELTRLMSAYNLMLEGIRKNARDLEASLKGVSGATKAGEDAIKSATAAAEKLEKAQRDAAFSITETGKAVELLKAKTKEQNKATVEQDKASKEMVGSYNALTRALNDAVNAWKAMGEGTSTTELYRTLNTIKGLSSQLAVLNAELKAYTVTVTENQKAEAKLNFLRSDEGKQLLATRRETQEYIRTQAEEAAKAKELAGTYDAIQRELNETVAQYKAMRTEANKDSAAMADMRDKMINLRGQLREIKNEMQGSVSSMSMVEKEQEKLNRLLAEDITTLERLRHEQREAVTVEREYWKQQEKLAKAQRDLANAHSTTAREIYRTQQAEKEQTRIMQLNEQIINSSTGSYKQLSAQYGLLKIQIENHARVTKADKDAVAALEKQANDLYIAMKRMQENMGNHKLSLGEYNKVWNGLGYSVAQVVREIPSAAISLNTFFLAISNNVPIVIDEIQRLRIKNKQLQAEGKTTVSVTKTIVKALFNWQTALILVMAAMSMHGKEIIEWLKDVWNGTLGIATMEKTLSRLEDKLKKSSATFGEQVATLRKLSKEWKELGNNMQKQTQFVKDNAAEFRKLDVNVKSVNDAESLLVKNTEAFIRALTLRAKSAAAMQVAAEAYGKALKKQIEFENKYSRVNEKPGATTRETAKAMAQKAVLPPQNAGSKGPFEVPTLEDLQKQQNPLNIDEDAIKKYVQERNELIDIMLAPRNSLSPEQINKLANLSAEEYENISREAQKKSDEYRNKQYANVADWKDKLWAGFTTGWGLWGNYEQKKGVVAKQSGVKMLEDIKQYNEEGDMAITITEQLDEEFRKIIEDLGLEGWHKDDTVKKLKDLTNTILKNDITVKRKYNATVAKLTQDEFEQRKQEAKNAMEDENNRLSKMLHDNREYLAKQGTEYKKLTAEQVKMIEAQNEKLGEAIINNAGILALQLEQIEKEQQIYTIQVMRETLTWRIDTIANSIKDEKALKLAQLESEKRLVLQSVRNAENGARSEAEVIAEFEKKKVQIISEYEQKITALKQTSIDAQVELVKKGSDKELQLLLEQNNLALQQAKLGNKAKPAAEQQDEAELEALYKKKAAEIKANFYVKQLEQLQDLRAAEFKLIEHSETETTKFQLQQERDMWLKKIELAEAGGLDWSQVQIDAAKATVKGLNKEIKKAGNFMTGISQYGIGGALLDKLGFNKEYISAMDDVVNKTVESIKEIIAAEVELAEAAVEAAETRTEAAKSAYEAEVEARANGYANNVATAKAEYELEKKNQKEKERLLVEAQRRQEQINTVTQVSSLITATANLWSSLSGIPIVGYALAIAAIAGMWSSFAAAKIKARQVTAKSQEYGEGGLEFLEGGSHASGNDIDLQTTNRKGYNMRAEGGEALAIINKRQTRRYKHVLPDVINSLNKGTFEDKYINAFADANSLSLIINGRSSDAPDLSKLEREVSAIKKQNDLKYYVLPNGDMVIIQGNVKRIIKK